MYPISNLIRIFTVSNKNIEQAVQEVAATQARLDLFNKCGGIDELDNARLSLDSARDNLANAIQFPDYQFTYLLAVNTWLYETNLILNQLLAC